MRGPNQASDPAQIRTLNKMMKTVLVLLVAAVVMVAAHLPYNHYGFDKNFDGVPDK